MEIPYGTRSWPEIGTTHRRSGFLLKFYAKGVGFRPFFATSTVELKTNIFYDASEIFIKFVMAFIQSRNTDNILPKNISGHFYFNQITSECGYGVVN